jgi:hypothetical protein
MRLPILSLSFMTRELCYVDPSTTPNADEVRAWINEMRVMALNGTESFPFNGHTNTLNRLGILAHSRRRLGVYWLLVTALL